MSLTLYDGSFSGVVREAFENPVITLSTSAISVVMAIMALRGVLSFGKDTLRLGRKMAAALWGTGALEDKDTQTELYFPELPGEIFWNPNSEVYHISGCHHVGLRATRKTACVLCGNRF